MSDWRAQYEDDASAEGARLARMSDDELLSIVRRRATNGYFAVWHTLGTRSPTRAICWTLYDVLQGGWPYLDKYHCAAALLRLLRCTEFEEVALSADWPVVPDNLRRLRTIIVETVGEPG